MSCFCYLHIFPNEKIYVGTTQQDKVEYRWGSNGGGYKGQSLIWNAIQKYGWENIKHRVIVCETPEKMWEKEKELIKEYDTTNPEHGYNCSTGGEYTMTGFHHTDKTKIKMSESHKDRPLSEEHRRKISESLKGRTLTEEHRRNIGDAGKGRHHTEEVKRKISESHKGKKNPPITEETRKKLSDANKGDKHPMYGKHHTEDARRKMSESNKGKSRNKGVSKPKSKWLTPEGEIREMSINNVSCWHKDWKLIQNQ